MEISNLKFWVQKTLPQVYDDSLSFYELLNKVVHYLNTVIDGHNELTKYTETKLAEQDQDIQNITNQLNDMKNWIDTYVLPTNLASILDEWFDNGKLGDIINNVFSKVSKIREMQLKRYGNYLSKIRHGGFTIIAQGDSLTIGQGGTSVSYPSQLQTVLRTVTGKTDINVVNWGIGGQTVSNGFNSWSEKPEVADLFIFMYGTNDNTQKVAFSDYVNNYLNLLYRNIVEWGVPAVIMSPLRNWNQEGIDNLQVFRQLSKMIADTCNIPYVDGFEILATATKDFFTSDTVHLTDKGYALVGTRIASLLLSNGEPTHIGNGKDLIIDKTLMNLISPSIISGASEQGGGGYQTGSGWAQNIIYGKQLTFPIYCDEDNLVLIPVYNATSDFSMRLDLDVDQGNGMLPVVASTDMTNLLTRINKKVTLQAGNIDPSDNTKVNITTNNYMVIGSRGLHLITFENGDTDTAILEGIMVLSWSVFKSLKNYRSSKPSEGKWKKGDFFYNHSPSSGGYMGWVCVEGGTFNPPATGLTATTIPWSSAVKLDKSTGLNPGDRFRIAGLDMELTATSGIYGYQGAYAVNINTNSISTVVTGAVTLSTPTWKGFGLIES